MGKQGSFGVAGGIYTWRYSSGEIHSWRKRDLWLTVHTSETCYEYSCGQIKGISNWLIVDLPLRAVRMGHTLLGSFSFVRGVWVTPGHLLLWAVHLETPPPPISVDSSVSKGVQRARVMHQVWDQYPPSSMVPQTCQM